MNIEEQKSTVTNSMGLTQIAKDFLPPAFTRAARRITQGMALSRYHRNGRVPWSSGYGFYRSRFIDQGLRDQDLLQRFRRREPLPPGYGVAVDERCVEYLWLVAQLDDGPEVLLDAGSTLNHEFILDQPVFRRKVMHILTLAPEATCFWQRGISYLFGDLRDIPIRDGYYDTIACLSTLEHVGCDNTLYTDDPVHREYRSDGLVLATRELFRVLKPGGSLYLTVPFGAYRHYGTFQQFDRDLLSGAVASVFEPARVTETFYRYSAAGWQLADPEECADCEYVEWINRPQGQWPKPMPVEPDRAAAARAVACVRLVKE